MKSQKRVDTVVEVAVRSRLHRLGLRFRVDYRPVETSRARADIVFVRARIAVFIDGCFWHGCPIHATQPRANADWWRTKLEGNIARDTRTNVLLAGSGWKVLRYWEHEDPDGIATAVAAEVVVARLQSRAT